MRKQLNKYLGGFLIIAAVAIGFQLTNLTENSPVYRVAQSDPEKLAKLPEPVKVSSRLLFGGDIFLGRRMEQLSLQQTSPYAYPFSKLDSLNKDAYQAWIANLECPSTNTKVSYFEQETYLRFNCLPDFLPELAKWFEIVSLANNHTDNVNGQTGLDETRSHLDKNNIQYFGHYDNSIKEDICEVVTVGALMSYDNGAVENTQLPVALCGVHGVFRIPLDDELAVIENYAKYLPVIVMPHMGAEYQPSQDNIRTTAFRKMVDYGADVIAGGHPHWVQNAESYEGKLIVYSMGNLIFDQQFSTEVMRSAMLDITIEVEYNDNTAKWLALAPSCTVFQDDCLNSAEAESLSKLDASFKHDVVATQNPDMLARLADDATRNSVLERLNWQNTLSKLY